MWEDSAGRIGINGVTLLAGFLVVLIVVMGGYTATVGQEGLPSRTTETQDQSYRIAVTESTVAIENLDSRPNVYSQLVVYLAGDGTNQQLPLEEDDAVGDDGDRLFERGERLTRDLNRSVTPGSPTTVKLVDTAESEILFETTVNATEASDS